MCIVAEVGSFLFCTIAASQLPSGSQFHDNIRDIIDGTLWEDEKWAHTSISPVKMDRESLQWIVNWSQGQQNYALVEYPDIILPAFQPTLLALQKMACNPKIPFLDYIVPHSTGSQPPPILEERR